ncbi:nitrile hydratase accessory protein [Pararhodobacter aggregans]|uniref:nitrile hydratase accessory protein n=1 Tax=Pararhodobacter aggregans TaxID=404875 RepID=UPI003A94651F
MTTPEPKTPDHAPFQAPWQAQLFGVTVALADAGVFTWPDWTRALGAEIARETPYWEAWLVTLETLLAGLGVALPPEVAALAHLWEEAAHATPHGQPILLENAPV